jgi:peptidylprolyl isomerase/peptidyl-prolyl cis-trans isomerase B (cyclophilin B)
MKSGLRATLLLAALLLSGCDHHQGAGRNANAASAPQGDSALTGVPPQPLDSMKGARRATLVALPGQPIPPQETAPASAPVSAAPAPAITESTPPPASDTTASSHSQPPDASQLAANSPPPAAADSQPAPVAPAPLPGDTANSTPGATGANPGVSVEAPENSEVAVIQTSMGKIVIELDDYAAPKTCKNFRELIADGFYNNTVFHRVIPNFIIQGGDPKSKTSAANRDTYGLGSPGYTLPAEIALKHDRGAVGMARLPDSVNPQRESNGSQFYICLGPCPSLDDQYTVFGHVIQGLDVAEKIATQPRDARDNPLQRIEMTVSLQPKDQAMANASTASP